MASSKPNPHSRFIPREEIDGVAAWHFSAMDGSDDTPNAAMEDGSTGEGVTSEVLQEARQQAYADGFARGHDAGGQEVRDALEATVRKTAEETAVRMAQLLHNTRDHLKKSEEKISRHILELACDLARQVVRQELRGDPEHLKPVIAEALTQLADDGLPATVRMNPGDLAMMQGVLRENLGNHAPEFVADPAISPGGCLIESATTAVDATIEKRWARAVGNLGLDAAWNPKDMDV
ncbi:MAG: flagellar assembly protein FliH [Hydrogenophaga sp.]|uniref:FliH/SctL family protein n=1 Tax=Hydrogenophaga sp. TaxID=1904254 RepID=UPI002637E861|nr:flagellar assembly protein FliH [Hydrogenophaga sp.]MCV0439278.1 flagellar assembly protein FliH [Hydrogenophaga sp.]